MQTIPIRMDKGEARDLWRKYRTHQHYSTPADLEIQAIYRRIAQGRTVVKALASIAAAGLNDQGLPRLAIIRADAERCHYRGTASGAGYFSMTRNWRATHTRRNISLPAGSFVGQHAWMHAEAIPPPIPLHLRPKRGLANYHILWEAEWEPVPPGDPLLLRRFGRGDAWLVCAAWDLTEVEKTVLAARLNG